MLISSSIRNMAEKDQALVAFDGSCAGDELWTLHILPTILGQSPMLHRRHFDGPACIFGHTNTPSPKKTYMCRARHHRCGKVDPQ
jgi:hypothetical protein